MVILMEARIFSMPDVDTFEIHAEFELIEVYPEK